MVLTALHATVHKDFLGRPAIMAPMSACRTHVKMLPTVQTCI